VSGHPEFAGRRAEGKWQLLRIRRHTAAPAVAGPTGQTLTNSMHPSTLAACLLWGQGIYFLITAVWPLASIRTFERVTGPKTDDWLVKTVAVLTGVVASVLLLAALRGRASPEVALLATGSAAGLGTIDVIYVLQRRIRRIYLLDAVVEGCLLLLWAAAWPRT
jgi:hypothetical protein